MVPKSPVSPARNWQDWISLLLGVWLFLSPWQLLYVDISQVASEAAWVIGAVLFVVGLLSRFTFHVAEEVIGLIFGLCLIISPWVLGYVNVTTAAGNAVIVGALVSLLSLWEIWDARHDIPHLA